MYKYEKAQCLQGIILFIIELFADFKCFFFFNIKSSSVYWNMGFYLEIWDFI